MEELSVKQAAKIGFGFGIGFMAAAVLASVLGFILYSPILFGL